MLQLEHQYIPFIGWKGVSFIVAVSVHRFRFIIEGCYFVGKMKLAGMFGVRKLAITPVPGFARNDLDPWFRGVCQIAVMRDDYGMCERGGRQVQIESGKRCWRDEVPLPPACSVLGHSCSPSLLIQASQEQTFQRAMTHLAGFWIDSDPTGCVPPS